MNAGMFASVGVLRGLAAAAVAAAVMPFFTSHVAFSWLLASTC